MFDTSFDGCPSRLLDTSRARLRSPLPVHVYEQSHQCRAFVSDLGFEFGVRVKIGDKL